MRKFALLVLALALAGCSSAGSLGSIVSPPEHVGPGSSPSPDRQWTPPPSAVPPAVEQEKNLTLPPDVKPGSAISLAQAIDVALSNNPSTRAAWLATRAAEAALGSRRSAYLPEVGVSAGVFRGTNSQGLTQTNYGPAASLTYLLFDFGGRAAQVEEARQALIATAYSQNQIIQDTVLRTEEAYYNYLNAKALVDAQAATLRERQTALDVANGRHTAGVSTVADVLQAQTALSQAQLTFEAFDGNVRSAEGALSYALGFSPTTRFTAGDLPADLPVETASQTAEKLMDEALARRPDLAASRAAVLNARARVRDVRSQGLPTLGLTSAAATTWSGSSSDSTNTWSAGITLRFPLFTGFRNTYDMRQAEALAEATQENARGLANLVGLQVWNSYYALQTAARRVKTSRDLLASAGQSVDVETGRYKAGVGSIINLLNAEAALGLARAQEVQARADWLVAVAQLAHDAGTLAPLPQGK